jgi:hypothetical protein
MWSIDEDRWFGVQLGERTDLIDRGQHHVGTGLGGDGEEVVRWQERIYGQGHYALPDCAGEGFSEARTIRQHNQHSIRRVQVEPS